MPITVEHTLYRFDELSDRAKETARDWWRELEATDFDTEFVIEDAQRMGAILGIEFDTRPVKLMNGNTRYGRDKAHTLPGAPADARHSDHNRRR